MRVGILSDTHDKLARTLTAIDMLAESGADAFIHCGDLTGPDIVRAFVGRPTYFVFGNNEDELGYLRQAMRAIGGQCLGWGGEITLGGKRLAVTHGHLFREMQQLLAAQPDYFLSGHTHEAHDRRESGTRWINPGALQRAEHYSVALLELETDFLQFLPVPR